MATDVRSNLVPKLRFSQFAQEPPWLYLPLYKLAVQITRRNTHGAELRPLTNSAEFGVIDQRKYFHKDIATNTLNYFVVEKGDYVYNPRISLAAPVGPISKNQLGTGVMSPLYIVFRFQSDSNDFFAHYFKSSHWHEYLRRVSNRGARHDRMAITIDDLMRMPIPTASQLEQQKIADCLGSLDELITATDKKLEALRLHKQGLLQHLFPQPGETVPRLRFPEFLQSSGWKHVKVADLIETVNPPKKLLTSTYKMDGRFPIIDQSANYICGWTNDDEAILNTPLPVVVFGDHTCVLKYIDQPFAQGADGIKIFTVRSYVSTIFLYYQLSYKPVVMEQYKRHFSTLKNKVVCFPELESGEQRKISDCLGSLDELITATGRKLETLRQHKQGLMQQLFPSLEGQ